MFKRRITPFTCILVSLLVFIATFVGVNAIRSVLENAEKNQLRLDSASKLEIATEDEAGFQTLSEMMSLLNDNSISKQDKAVIWDNIYRAFAMSLNDNYSQYFSTEEYQNILDSQDGSFVGIGIRVVLYEPLGGIYVYSVVSGSPAEQAGMQAGDILVAVNDMEFNGNNFDEVINAVAGEVDTDVSVTVMRNGAKHQFTVTRAVVPSENVYYKKLDNGIAYIAVYSFADTTVSSRFAAAIEKAQGDGCDRFIFDVRNNPGGYLDQICNSLDILLPEGPIINIVEKGNKVTTMNSDKNCISAKGMVVLCNGQTASAAELFTAALRDYKLAAIVGTTTFGKGTVQTTFKLEDGSMFKLSTAYYTPPSNVKYDGIGIIPDYVTELSEEWKDLYYAMPMAEDTQLQKAIEILNSTN